MQPKNNRRRTKGRIVQVIKIPLFIIKEVDGKEIKVKPKNAGKIKTIRHKPSAL
jgi:hypothetical protein